jgi:hypothetical protein
LVALGNNQQFHQQSHTPSLTSTISSNPQVLPTLTSLPAITGALALPSATPSLLMAATPANPLAGMVIYKAPGITGPSEIYLYDLTTGRQTQVTDNQGYLLKEEKISDSRKYLAFLFDYGDNDNSKLGVIDLDRKELIQINNDIRIAATWQFDWLPNDRIIYANPESQNIELYDPSSKKVEALGAETSYHIFDDRKTIALIDAQNNHISVGSLDNGRSDFKQIQLSDGVEPNLLLHGQIIWAPDGKKFAVRTSSYYTKDKDHISVWSSDGIRDRTFPVENADWISFTWIKDSAQYALIVGNEENKLLKNTLYVGSKTLALEEQYPLDLKALPDDNLVYGTLWGGITNLVDQKTLNIQKISGGPFTWRAINTDLAILQPDNLHEGSFILADKNGFHKIKFSPSTPSSWKDVWSGNGLKLLSENQIFDVASSETKGFSLPSDSTAISWAPVNTYVNVSLLPTVAPVSGFDVLFCDVRNYREGSHFVAHRTCTCRKDICDCTDYSGGGTKDWTREQRGIELYFGKMGGSCSRQ